MREDVMLGKGAGTGPGRGVTVDTRNLLEADRIPHGHTNGAGVRLGTCLEIDLGSWAGSLTGAAGLVCMGCIMGIPLSVASWCWRGGCEVVPVPSCLLLGIISRILLVAMISG